MWIFCTSSTHLENNFLGIPSKNDVVQGGSLRRFKRMSLMSTSVGVPAAIFITLALLLSNSFFSSNKYNYSIATTAEAFQYAPANTHNIGHHAQRHQYLQHHLLGTTTITMHRRSSSSSLPSTSSASLLTLSLSSSSNNNKNDNGDDHETESFISPIPPQPRSSDNDTIPSVSSPSIRLKQQKRRLTREFFSIALPAFLQLAAEPLAGLVDTAYLGRLGPDILGGAGVAISAQYAVSKLYNDPLLRTSISLVASEDGRNKERNKMNENENSDRDDGDGSSTDRTKQQQLKQQLQVQQQQQQQASSLSIAVSSAILLAFTVGAIQLLLYYTFASSILRGMGVSPLSSMYPSAYSYLRVRALGTPAATLWLVTNGIYRGLGDTSTPLKYSLAFTLLNAILDPIFIFTWKFGASGAAAGTALAQYVALVPLLYSLHKRVGIDVLGQWRELGKALKEYLRAGTYVFARTIGKVLAYSVCARQAALLGPVAAAAYNLTFQLGFATTQICESVAVAVQTLLAREVAGGGGGDGSLSRNDGPEGGMRALRVRHLINGSILVGGLVAGSLSLLTFFQKESVIRGLTTDAGVREASAIIFPAVLITQVLKGLAYPVNGIIMGGLDWKFTMLAMWLANFVCVGMIRSWANAGVMTLGKIWWALAAFMGTQVVTGIIRFQSKTGIWKILQAENRASTYYRDDK